MGANICMGTCQQHVYCCCLAGALGMYRFNAVTALPTVAYDRARLNEFRQAAHSFHKKKSCHHKTCTGRVIKCGTSAGLGAP